MTQKMFLITENEMDEYKRLKEQENTTGRKITIREWEEYQKLKAKNRKMGKWVGFDHLIHRPVCGYVVDHGVPPQTYCDRCGQRLDD